MRTIALASSLALAFGAACSAAKAPDKPTWVDDVQPLLQANCSHCHGGTWLVTGERQRFDICDTSGFADSGYLFNAIDDSGMNLGPAATGANRLAKTLAADTSNDYMPPAPAGGLPQYEKDVLANWAAINPKGSAPCGTRPGNHKPVVKLIGTPKYANQGVTVTVQITDADHDPVVGTMFVGPDCDPTPPDGFKVADPATSAVPPTECMMRPRVRIASSGRQVLKIADGVDADAPLVIRVSDGWGDQPNAVVKEF
jgi:hypothetical protein